MIKKLNLIAALLLTVSVLGCGGNAPSNEKPDPEKLKTESEMLEKLHEQERSGK